MSLLRLHCWVVWPITGVSKLVECLVVIQSMQCAVPVGCCWLRHSPPVFGSNASIVSYIWIRGSASNAVVKVYGLSWLVPCEIPRRIVFCKHPVDGLHPEA